MRTASGIATAVIVATAGAAAGCSDKKALTSRAPSTTAPTSASPSATRTPTPSAPPRRRPSKTPDAVSGPNAKFASDPAVQAFFAYVQARRAALHRRSMSHGPYVRVSTAAIRGVDADFLREVKRDDLELRGPGYIVVKRSTKRGTNQVLIRICEDDDEAVWFSRKTGKRAFPVANRWSPQEVRVVRVDGRWKVHAWTDAGFKCEGELK